MTTGKAMTSDTPDAKAQTTEQLVAEVVAYLRAEADFNRSWTDGRRKAYGDRRGYIARRIELAEERERWADAILAITDPQTVRKAALEEAARRVELMTPGGLPHAHPYARQCYIAQAIRALAASPAPTTDTTT